MRPFPCLPLLLLLSLSPLSLQEPKAALPLSSSARWVVDTTGRRVKLACVNWPSHLEPMLAEGLGKQPLDFISKMIVSMGFNCVRLTWPTFLATNESLSKLTVRQSFQSLGLNESLAGIHVNNPGLLDLTLIQAYQCVVSNLAANHIMVILDNHISKPGWCCGVGDGNGFFGDKYFKPDVWIPGLKTMAKLFKGSTNVIAMSLRNELRGHRQNVSDWYRYMQAGAEEVHAANPHVLVILSGLSFDTNLSFLSDRQVNLSFTGKVVFELHWYSFSDGRAWNGNPNDVCGRIVGNVNRKAAFLLDQGWPLFMSEWGVDQRGGNEQDNRYFGCVLGVAAELDLDWALWTLQGSYYLRQGILDLDEVYGVLGWDWSKPRDSTILQRTQALQSPFRGPGLADVPPYKILFHPSSGLCVQTGDLRHPSLQLGPCSETGKWNYTAEQTLLLLGVRKMRCLQADGPYRPVKLGATCTSSQSQWKLISRSKMHLSSKTTYQSNSTAVCLDVGPDGKSLFTNPCTCLSQNTTCNPESQWFKMVNSTRKVIRENSIIKLPFQDGRWKTF